MSYNKQGFIKKLMCSIFCDSKCVFYLESTVNFTEKSNKIIFYMKYGKELLNVNF